MVTRRFDVWLANFDPIIGSEIGKARPCVIVSPDSANKYLRTIIVAPLTSTIKTYPTRVHCTFDHRDGQIALDQMRAIDKIRLIKKLGNLDAATNKVLCSVLVNLFTYA